MNTSNNECPSGLYNSFGRCRQCAGGINPKNVSTNNNVTEITPVYVLSLSIGGGVLMVLFLSAVSWFWCASLHGKNTSKEVWSATKYLVSYIMLSMQPATMVGNIVRFTGPDVLSPMHEVIIGSFHVIALDFFNSGNGIPFSCLGASLISIEFSVLGIVLLLLALFAAIVMVRLYCNTGARCMRMNHLPEHVQSVSFIVWLHLESCIYCCSYVNGRSFTRPRSASDSFLSNRSSCHFFLHTLSHG